MPIPPEQIDVPALADALAKVMPTGRQKNVETITLGAAKTSVKLSAKLVDEPLVSRNGVLLNAATKDPTVDEFTWKAGDDVITVAPLPRMSTVKVVYWT